MKHVTIPLSDAQHEMLEAGVFQGEYASIADYVAALVDAAARARAQERLEELLLEGLKGEPVPWTATSMRELTLRAREGL